LNLLGAGFKAGVHRKSSSFFLAARFSSGNPYLFCNSAQRVETLVRGSGLKIATYQLNRTNQRLAGTIGQSGHIQGEEEK